MSLQCSDRLLWTIPADVATELSVFVLVLEWQSGICHRMHTTTWNITPIDGLGELLEALFVAYQSVLGYRENCSKLRGLYVGATN